MRIVITRLGKNEIKDVDYGDMPKLNYLNQKKMQGLYHIIKFQTIAIFLYMVIIIKYISKELTKV